MKKLLPITAAAFLSFAGMAHAATLITLAPTVTYNVGGAVLTPNVDLSTLSSSQLQLTGDALVIDPSSSLGGQYKAPDGGAVFANNYLAVIAVPVPPEPSSPGSAVYNAGGVHTLGFTWGSVDGYNTLTLDTTNGVFTIKGTDIQSNIPGVSLGSSDEDVVFQDNLGTILSATFDSSQNSFEVANFETAVPLPATLSLFGAALLGFGVLAYNRRRKVA